MNKRLIIFGVLLAALLLSAVSPWPAVLTVVNGTGKDIYITLKYRGVQKYFLTATKQGNAYDPVSNTRYSISLFEVSRLTYSATVTACDTTTSWGRLRMVTNVRLTFPKCLQMQRASAAFYNADFVSWVKGDAAVRTALCTKYGVAPCPTASNKPPAQINKKINSFGWWGEPTLEKVNFWYSGTFEWTPPDWGWYGSYNVKGKSSRKPAFRFLYDLIP